MVKYKEEMLPIQLIAAHPNDKIITNIAMDCIENHIFYRYQVIAAFSFYRIYTHKLFPQGQH